MVLFPPGTGWLRFLFEAALVTLQLSSAALVVGTVLGALVGLGLASGRRWAAWPARLYVETFRSVPILLQMFFIYYALPGLLGIDLPAYPAGVLALGLYCGSFMAEVVRTGVAAIGRPQWDAAYSIGMRPVAVMHRVIAPQAFRIMAPPAVGIAIGTLKDSSVASVIGLVELLGAGVAVRDSNLGEGGIGVLAIVSGLYFVMCYSLSLLGGAIERRWPV
jgi:His/Glu/Gln/Arg/opine family amino acid ABC transporter permease subunit